METVVQAETTAMQPEPVQAQNDPIPAVETGETSSPEGAGGGVAGESSAHDEGTSTRGIASAIPGEIQATRMQTPAYKELNQLVADTHPGPVQARNKPTPTMETGEVPSPEGVPPELVAEIAREVRRRVLRDIQARGARPAENGTAGRAPATLREPLPSEWSREERDRIGRKALQGIPHKIQI